MSLKPIKNRRLWLGSACSHFQAIKSWRLLEDTPQIYMVFFLLTKIDNFGRIVPSFHDTPWCSAQSFSGCHPCPHPSSTSPFPPPSGVSRVCKQQPEITRKSCLAFRCRNSVDFITRITGFFSVSVSLFSCPTSKASMENLLFSLQPLARRRSHRSTMCHSTSTKKVEYYLKKIIHFPPFFIFFLI